MTDVGKSLFCRVTATNAAGSASADSNTVGPVTAAGGGAGVFSLVASTSLGSVGGAAITTGGINTTGAGLLVVGLGGYSESAPYTITDNKGNTWTGLTAQAEPSTSSHSRIFYCAAPVVGTGHTITLPQSANYAHVTFLAFAGGAAAPFDVENGEILGGVTTIGPAITPTVNNELIIANVAFNTGAAAPTISAGTVVGGTGYVTGDHYGHGMAYLIQTTAALADLDWTLGATANAAASIASFKFS